MNNDSTRPPCEKLGRSLRCDTCIDFLLEYLDNQLSEDQRFAFDSHIAYCRDCETYLRNYRAAMNLASNVTCFVAPDADAPEALIQAILKARRHDHPSQG